MSWHSRDSGRYFRENTSRPLTLFPSSTGVYFNLDSAQSAQCFPHKNAWLVNFQEVLFWIQWRMAAFHRTYFSSFFLSFPSPQNKIPKKPINFHLEMLIGVPNGCQSSFVLSFRQWDSFIRNPWKNTWGARRVTECPIFTFSLNCFSLLLKRVQQKLCCRFLKIHNFEGVWSLITMKDEEQNHSCGKATPPQSEYRSADVQFPQRGRHTQILLETSYSPASRFSYFCMSCPTACRPCPK